jgi:hypothetical protein
MTLTIELSDDIYKAVCLEAKQSGLIAKERVERMVTKMHENRVKHLLREAYARLDKMEQDGFLLFNGLSFTLKGSGV